MKMTSPCCNAPLYWTSYNQELWKEPKVDHWTCSKCEKPIVSIDTAALTYPKPEQLDLFHGTETGSRDRLRIWRV